jgi:hypothetical protein
MAQFQQLPLVAQTVLRSTPNRTFGMELIIVQRFA